MTFMGPSTAINACLKGYSTFSGRASRSEFWWWFLLWLFTLSFTDMVGLFGVSVPDFVFYIELAWFLLLLLPTLAVTVRRLHDTNRDGILLPVVLAACLIPPFMIPECSYGTEGDGLGSCLLGYLIWFLLLFGFGGYIVVRLASVGSVRENRYGNMASPNVAKSGAGENSPNERLPR